MRNAILGRLGRRLTAIGAGAALVAAGLSLGVMAPAGAASPVIGGVTDAFGNPVPGYVTAYELDPATGQYDTFGQSVADAGDNGSIGGGPFDVVDPGTYKFQFRTYSGYTEWYKDAPDMASAAAVTVTDGVPVDLGAWTIDQPYLVGKVTNATGKPLNASLTAYDAATGDVVSFVNTTELGEYKIPVLSTPVKVLFSGPRNYADEFYIDSPDFANATPVTGTNLGAALNDVVLVRAGAITGLVTSDAGAPLEFVLAAVVNANGETVAYDYTDKSGVFTIKNVPTGPNVVWFFDPIREYIPEYFNNSFDRAQATPIQVGVGQVVPNANAALTPVTPDPTKTVEVTGTVKDNLGAPIVGALVSAEGTPASKTDLQSFEDTYSNRQGVYAFTELEKVQGENQFKVSASAYEQGDDNAFALFDAYQGGGQDYDRAPAVTVTPGTPVQADIVLERAGGVSGSVVGAAGTPLDPWAYIEGVADGDGSGGVEFEADDTFKALDVRPGTYTIRFGDSSGFHASEWWKDKALQEDAVTITVKSGQMTGGLNAVLGTAFSAIERPETSSPYAWVGKALTANPGVWTMQTDTSFKYEWVIGGTVVATGNTFTPAKSNIGDRVTLRVTGENGRLVGTATAKATSKVGYQPKVKVKAKGGKASLTVKAPPVKAKKVKGKVVVKEIVKVKADGTIKYKKVAKGKVKKGKAAISLAKLKKGKHKLVFFFTGSGKVGSTEVKKTVKR